MAGLLVGQVVASKKALICPGHPFQHHPDPCFWIFIIAYTVAGGLKAVVLTDVLSGLPLS